MTSLPPQARADEPADLTYRSCAHSFDTGAYDPRSRDQLADDWVMRTDTGDLDRLATSPRWQDRVRAENLRHRIEVTLPDQFPCIFERPDSPANLRVRYVTPPEPTPWVISPDIDMLTTLLPDYQELWDSYTAQWGPKSRRVFAVGRLDGLPVGRVYRPDATPSQVIGATFLTHPDMYPHAPERLKMMHPY